MDSQCGYNGKIMIQFEELIIEGFGSLIKRKTFKLNLEGLNILRGKVGSGKTSIPSAMYWILYGTTLKKGSTIQTWEEHQDNNFKGTFGQLNFRIGKNLYSIIRCIQYKGVVFEKQKGGSKILIIKNGKELKIEDKGKRQIQSTINDIIGYSPELFINSIVYGQRLKRIIEESGPNKKKIFDEAFETLFIDKAKDKTAIKLRDANNLWAKLKDKQDTLEDQHGDIKSTIVDLLAIEANFKKDKKAKVQELEEEIDKVTQEIGYNEKQLKSLKGKKGQNELNTKLDQLAKLLKVNKESLEKYKELSDNHKVWKDKLETKKEHRVSLKSSICNKCGSTISNKKKDSLLSKLDKEISKLTIARDNAKIKLQSINVIKLNKATISITNRIDRTKLSLNEIKSNNRTKELLESNINNLGARRTKLSSRLKEANNTKLEYKSEKYKAKEAKVSKKLKAVKSDLEIVSKEIEMFKWLIKEPLSNSGIKAYIFDSLLTQVNDNLKNYSEILGFRVEFGIDMETAAKDFYQVIYKDDLIINYPDLSGGQKQLVDNSVALAIHDVITTLKPVNVIFLDEPFEGLDVETIDVISEIIAYKAINRSLFIITHHSSFNPTNSNNIYFNLDSKGNTQIN